MVLYVENDSIFLFDSELGPSQVIAYGDRVDIGVIAIKRPFTFLNVPRTEASTSCGNPLGEDTLPILLRCNRRIVQLQPTGLNSTMIKIKY